MIAEDQKSKTKKLCSATRLTISMSASGDLFDLYFPICSISSPPHRAPNFCKFGVSSGSWIVKQSVGKKGCLTG
ncbi:hypothetical protein C1H46_006962 [Malus baccata]|uniref:Uncharacterized protein n=1 Tax=Malus baccata TaxID=106549 RepID=A0A540N8H0_MALBA|nr:hypothetical protein C1H46_006962 [Malus baccata]